MLCRFCSFLARPLRLLVLFLADQLLLPNGEEVQGQFIHPTLGRIKQVVWGQYHTIFVRQDGYICCEGSNGFGQLGDGTTLSRAPGDPVCVFKDVKMADVGTFHTVLVQDNGVAWAFGRNDQGQLGDRTTIGRKVGRRIMTGVVQVAAGCDHTLFLKTDGTVYASGANHDGQLGDGYHRTRNSPVQVAQLGYHRVPERSEDGAALGALAGPAMEWRDGMSEADEAQKALEIQYFTYYSYNERVDAAVPFPNVVQVSAGCVHSLYRASDGTAWGAGGNMYGQIGDGSRLQRLAPSQVLIENCVDVTGNGSSSYFRKADGTRWQAGLTSTFGGRESRATLDALVQVV